MKINWKQKLSSRKFWSALIAWITSLLAAFNIADNTTTQIIAIASGIGALCVYMLAEGFVDHARAEHEHEEEETEKEPNDKIGFNI